jgi:hypothetical protein
MSEQVKPDYRPPSGWISSMGRYYRPYYKKQCIVEWIAGSWYCWVSGSPQEIPHATLDAACISCMKEARKKNGLGTY